MNRALESGGREDTPSSASLRFYPVLFWKIVWNSLPSELKKIKTKNSFVKIMKIFLVTISQKLLLKQMFISYNSSFKM